MYRANVALGTFLFYPMPQSMSQLVPLRNLRGRKVDDVTVAQAIINEGRWVVKRNGRGNVVQAMERVRVSTVPLSNRGEGIQQQLASGRIWTLRGTPGSESVGVA